MLVELCVGNYATSNGPVNEANGIFKTSITHGKDTQIEFKISKISFSTITK